MMFHQTLDWENDIIQLFYCVFYPTHQVGPKCLYLESNSTSVTPQFFDMVSIKFQLVFNIFILEIN
jgi:hypothetical protein